MIIIIKFSPQVLPWFVTFRVDGLHVDGLDGRTRWRRQEAEGAAPPCIPAVCTDVRRHGPGREQPLRSATGTEQGQSPASPR